MNNIMRFITIICFILLSAIVLNFIINLIIKNRRQRIEFLRSFKKGKFTIIFFILLPLYFIGELYNKINVIDAFFDTITTTMGLVVLKYDISDIKALMDDDSFYRITIYYSYILICINAIVFAISIFAEHLWHRFQIFKSKLSKKPQLYLFGNNSSNLLIYKSHQKELAFLVDSLEAKENSKMYFDKISTINTNNLKNTIVNILERVSKRKKPTTIIINTLDENKNINLSQAVVKYLEKLKVEKQDELFHNLNVYVFGNPLYDAIYVDIVASAKGCLHYLNKYQMIAMNFIERYPFAKFMDQERLDYKTALVKENVDINVCMIGFGKTNQQIFLTSVANNQFVTKVNNEISLKKINYHIFDKEYAQNNKNLNHNYYRFKNECENLDENKYLPLPSFPATEQYYKLDINENSFYNTIKKIVTNKAKDLNFVIIAFGSDLENIDLAQKLIEKRQEWNLDNLIIFVKVRTWNKKDTLIEQDDCYFIGNEASDVYNLKEILGDNIFKMTQMRDEIYRLEDKITNNDNLVITDQLLTNIHQEAHCNWYQNLTQLERDSNLYACLSLRFKLNLLGLDYCPIAENDLPALTEEEYLEIYAQDDRPDFTYYNKKIDDKKIIHYNIDFKQSTRQTLAIQEHYRWNSYMISKGIIPSSIEQILNETIIKDHKIKYTNGKNYVLRRHGNLTTFNGLITFRKLLSQRDQTTEENKDVIKYDYQLLDDAYWLLTKNGYKIIKKEDLK